MEILLIKKVCNLQSAFLYIILSVSEYFVFCGGQILGGAHLVRLPSSRPNEFQHIIDKRAARL